jgi:hypothetical protein
MIPQPAAFGNGRDGIAYFFSPSSALTRSITANASAT